KGDEATQRNLARLLGAWGHPYVDPLLATLASGRRQPAVQAEALQISALLEPTEEHPFPKVKEAVLKGLKGRTDAIKAAACSAAAAIGDAGFFDALVAIARREPGNYSGLYAVWALRQLGYQGGIGTFIHVLGSTPKKGIRQACLKAVTDLATSKKEDVEALLSMTKSGTEDYRDAAALALGRLVWRGAFRRQILTGENAPAPVAKAPTDVIDRLVSMVEKEKSWKVRDAARQSLIRIGAFARPAIEARMPRLIDFSDRDTRLTSIELCGLFRVKDAYEKLYKTAIYDKSRPVRMFAARALGQVDGKRASEDLLKVARAAGRKRRAYEAYAVQALGYVREPEAFEGLLRLIETKFEQESLMREVQFSLERLTGHRFGLKPDRWRKWYATAVHPLHPMIEKFDRPKNRRDVLKKGLYGHSMDTERAVERGLGWLELQQHPLGYWDGNEQGGIVNCEPAYTGLSLLAFLGAGYNPAGGKYRVTIRRAAEFLAATQFYDGSFPVTGGGDSSWIFAYAIAMGTWGITEAYAQSGDERFQGPAQ
ncbi:MAG: HEAT repeat domain-containing protein, partial [Planctomycetota bacterium]